MTSFVNVGESLVCHKQNMTSSSYNAITASSSSVVWNVQVPSEQTLIDRRVLWRATVILKMTAAGTPANQFPIQYGLTDALSPFPLHQLCSVQTSTINNNSVSINIRDVLPAMLRMNDIRELQRYNGTTPVGYDLTSDYSGTIGSNLNMLGGFNNAADNDLLPRGSWVLDGVAKTLTSGALTANDPLTVGYTGNFYVQFTVAEPLLLSPWIFADPQSNAQALYGVQNLNFVFNIGDGSRVWRSANTYVTATVPVVQSISNCQLVFNFLTPHPSDLMASRNVVPFYELPRYISSITAPTSGGVTSYSNASNAFQVRSTNIQLNQIPDKLILQVRFPMGSQNPNYPDFFYCISAVSVNFNNQSGILASATQQDLWRYSVENGSNQSWLEFSGAANLPDQASGAGRTLAMSGSLLVLEFGKDIQLTEDFYASGSLGNFNLQVNLSVYNQTPTSISGLGLELVIITMNSGVFVCEKGTSATYTGVLTKQDVLDASSQTPMSGSMVKRLVGGSFLDKIKSVVSHPLLKMALPHAKEFIKNAHPLAKKAVDMAESLGFGRAGGKIEAHIRK